MKSKMMKTPKSIITLSTVLLFCASLFLLSCKKEAGPAGPAGPAGANGKDGNASVKNYTMFITGSEWTNDVGESYVTKLLPELTADVISKGAVMAYNDGPTGVWTALPTTAATSAGVVLSLGYTIEVGKITFDMTYNQNAKLTAADIGNSNFRVVIIPSSSKAGKVIVNDVNSPVVSGEVQ